MPKAMPKIFFGLSVQTKILVAIRVINSVLMTIPIVTILLPIVTTTRKIKVTSGIILIYVTHFNHHHSPRVKMSVAMSATVHNTPVTLVLITVGM